MMILNNNNITIRDFKNSDINLMYKWLTDQRVLEWYDGRDFICTIDSLTKKYSEKLQNGFQMIIEYDGVAIGYAQAYQVTGDMFEEYDYQDSGVVVFAMDQFIGEVDYWNRGIGTQFLEMMSSYLQKTFDASIILLDPHCNNLRAIRCYEKAGFKIIKSLPKHELFEGKLEDCFLMEKVL